MNVRGLTKKAEKHLMQGVVKQQNRGGGYKYKCESAIKPQSQTQVERPKVARQGQRAYKC